MSMFFHLSWSDKDLKQDGTLRLQQGANYTLQSLHRGSPGEVAGPGGHSSEGRRVSWCLQALGAAALLLDPPLAPWRALTRLQ